MSKPDSCTCLFHSKCIENALGVNVPCPHCNATIINTAPFTSSYSSIIRLYKERFTDTLFQAQENRKTLSIRRRQRFGDTLKKISRCLTNGLCSLKIDFIGENDFGGPTREFFSWVLPIYSWPTSTWSINKLLLPAWLSWHLKRTLQVIWADCSSSRCTWLPWT